MKVLFLALEAIESHLTELARVKISGLAGRSQRRCPEGSTWNGERCVRTSASDQKRMSIQRRLSRRPIRAQLARKTKLYRKKRKARGL